MDVSIIIPTWKGKHLLEQNLPAVIEASQYKANSIKEVIIVDDGSPDNTSSYIKKNFGDKIRLIKHSQNRGFSAAVNTGVRMAKSPLVCLLNQDALPSKNFLEASLGHFKDTKVFAVSFHEPGAGYAIGQFKDGFFEHRGGEEAKTPQESCWASGGSAIFSRKKWLGLKGMDEALFTPFYWEDIDLSYRAAKRGYKILWEPNSIVIHLHEATINTDNFRKNYMDRIKERNQLLFIWKNITSPRLFRRHIKGLFQRTLKHPGYIKIILAAFAKRKEVARARKIEKKECRVSDEAIFVRFSS